MLLCYAPTANADAFQKSRRSIREIVFPFPNLPSWLFAYHHWVQGDKKTLKNRDTLQAMLERNDFDVKGIKNINFKALDKAVVTGNSSAPWDLLHDGWQEETIIIDISTGQKQTQASQRADAAASMRTARDNTEPDIPAKHPSRGYPYAVKFWRKSIVEEVCKTFSMSPAAKDFVYNPYILEHCAPGSLPSDKAIKCAFGELYTSNAWTREDICLQNLPHEPDCDLPRAIIVLMFWSDATQIAHFGQLKVWPLYQYYSNQSKNERVRPSCHAACPVAFFSTVSTLKS
jgi:hypothetical protein